MSELFDGCGTFIGTMSGRDTPLFCGEYGMFCGPTSCQEATKSTKKDNKKKKENK